MVSEPLVKYFYASPLKKTVTIGALKIMRKSQSSHWQTNGSPEWVFLEGNQKWHDGLNDDYCSIGIGYEYYLNLSANAPDHMIDILTSLRDAIYKPSIWEEFEDHSCFKVSLLRDKSMAIETRDKARKLLGIGEIVEKFSYELNLPGTINNHIIEFDFTKVGALPNRVNLIAGTNGAGKTQLMSRLAIELTGITSSDTGGEEELKKRQDSGKVRPIPSFYSVVAISFNPFDQFERPASVPDDPLIHYTYCGIRKDDNSIYSADELATKLRDLGREMSPDQQILMRNASKNVLGFDDFTKFVDEKSIHYRHLSAGQKIALNVMAHLIMYLKPRTLVLLDEPETHLHPSLMAALVTELLSLLDSTNSYAVVATHSPIIAQQVPSRYINVVRRDIDSQIYIEKPDRECFGGSLSEITNDLFDTREYERDYTKVLDAVLEQPGFHIDQIEELFPDGLGTNARTYIWSKAQKANLAGG